MPFRSTEPLESVLAELSREVCGPGLLAAAILLAPSVTQAQAPQPAAETEPPAPAQPLPPSAGTQPGDSGAAASPASNADAQLPATRVAMRSRCRVASVTVSDDFPPGCHLTDDVGCERAEADFKILSVWLEGSGSDASQFLIDNFTRFSVQAQNGTRVDAFLGGMQDGRLVLAFTPRKADEHFALHTPDSERPVDLDVPSSRWFQCSQPGQPSAPPQEVTPSDDERAQVLYEEGVRAANLGDDARADELFGRVQADFPASPYAALAARHFEDARQPRPRRGFTIGLAVDAGYGGFDIKDPFLVERTTTSYSPDPFPTTTTVTGPVPVRAVGNGPAFGLDFRLGGMLSPRIALLFDVLLRGIGWAGRPKESTDFDGAYATTGHMGVTGQFFVLDHLWTAVGVGGGFAAYQGPQTSTTSSTSNDANLASGGGFSLLGGFGYELQHFADAKRNRALSLEARVHGIVVGDSSDWAATIGLGYQWY